MKEKLKITSFLGAGTEFEGNLRSSGSFRIDCHFEGNISAKGSLIVGKNALIKSDIHAFSVMVYGEIHGNILADHRVDILASGNVFGEIQTSIMTMDEGAILKGTVQMSKEKPENKSLLDVSASGKNIDISKQSLGMIHGIVMGGSLQMNDNINGVLALEEEREKCNLVENAKIVAVCGSSLKKMALTDSSGHYQVTDLEDGIWKLKVESEGYEAGEAMVEISGGGVYEQNFV